MAANERYVKISRAMSGMEDFVRDRGRFEGMLERWSVEGWEFSKRVYIKRDTGKKVRLTYKLIRAAVELCFSSNQATHFVYPDQEAFKPMSRAASKKKRCDVCSGSVKRGKEMCEKCQGLPAPSREIVKAVNPTVVITVDEKWRWITGHISLTVN